MFKKCIISMMVAGVLVASAAAAAPAAATSTTPAKDSAAVAAPDDLDQTQVRFRRGGPFGILQMVYFRGYEIRTGAGLAIVSIGGAAAAGCTLIGKAPNPATRVLCGAISAPVLFLINREVNRMIDADPRAANWCFEAGPIIPVSAIPFPVKVKVVPLSRCA